MGQTLEHDIYLPDEGERNCYNGLAANWQILDNSVGTIASHTTQIAGKANAVHTHGKADITDLFNSANEWTQINTYTVALRFSAANYSAGTPSSDIFYGSLQWGGIVNNTFVQSFGINNAIRSTGINDISLRVWSQTGSILRGVAVETNADASNSSFRPLVNNVTNLGSTVYQWNNIYSKGYYYNGIAWGLDKENTWTGANTFQGNLYHKSSSSALVKGTNPSSITYYGSFRHQTYAGDEINLFRGYIGTTGDNCYRWSVEPWVSGSNGRFQMRVSSDGSVRAFEVDGTEVSPYTDNATDLGTSTKRWKTLNGVNPGALSLPSADDESFNGDLTNKTGTTSNKKTWSINGWGYIRIANVAGDFISVVATSAHETYLTTGTGSGNDNIGVAFPIVSGREYSIYVKTSGSVVAYYMPTLGNVA